MAGSEEVMRVDRGRGGMVETQHARSRQRSFWQGARTTLGRGLAQNQPRPKRVCHLASSLLLAVAVTFPTGCRPSHSGRIVVGSKNFSEQVVLAELVAQHIEFRLHIPV